MLQQHFVDLTPGVGEFQLDGDQFLCGTYFVSLGHSNGEKKTLKVSLVK